MQKGVSTHIGDICPSTSHEEHLHNVPVTVHAGIVKGSKAMLITLVEIMIGVHGPLFAVVLIPILAGRVDVFTSRLRTKTYVETNRIISTHHNLQSLHTAFDWPVILDSGTTWDTLT